MTRTRRLPVGILALVLVAGAAAAAEPTMILGRAMRDDLVPAASAAVSLLTPSGAQTPCRSITAADGSFLLRCAERGQHRLVVASAAGTATQDVELTPGGRLELNLLIRHAVVAPLVESPRGLSARLPNPVLGVVGGHAATLREAALGGGIVAVLLVVLGVRYLGSRLGVTRRALSDVEVADLIWNGRALPAPLADRYRARAFGTVGASFQMTYDADDLVAALAVSAHGLVAACLVVPMVVGFAVLAFSLAALIGHEVYLLVGMSLVAGGFVVTPWLMLAQALRRRRVGRRHT